MVVGSIVAKRFLVDCVSLEDSVVGTGSRSLSCIRAPSELNQKLGIVIEESQTQAVVF